MKINKILATVLALVLVAASIPAVSAKAADDYVYGTLAYLTYGEYFSSELGDSAAVAADGYDTITSATTSKYKSFVNSAYTTDELTGETSIYGISNVPVRIEKSVYEAAVAGTNTAVAELLNRGFTVSNSELSVYKEIASDASISAYVGLTNTNVAADESSSISTDSVWGNYIVFIYANDGSSLESGKNIEGAYVTTTDGQTYPIYHSANLWFQAYEFSWVVEPDFTEPHGNKPYTASLTGLTGKTISSVTYIFKTTDENGNATFSKNTYNVGALKVKELLDDSSSVTATEANNTNNNTSDLTVTAPAGSNYSVASIDSLTEGTDYTVAATDTGFAITFAENVAAGAYTVTLTDDNYEDMTVSVVVSANVSEGDITIEDNALVINNENVSLDDFLAALSSATLTVNGTTISGGAAVLFNEDGTVNLDAKTSGRGAKALFSEIGSYEVVLTVPGYGTITGTVVKTEASEENSEASEVANDEVDNGEVAAEEGNVALNGTSETTTEKTNTNDSAKTMVYVVVAILAVAAITVEEILRRKKRA
ncbi:MAG: hypothetical protein II512_01970 [Lachnospira sp.]|nr:hypothetical protein [Lachnospira sp.]